MQGYADGTRNVYVEDKADESGIHQAVDASKAFDKYIAKLSKIDAQIDLIEVCRHEKNYSKLF